MNESGTNGDGASSMHASLQAVFAQEACERMTRALACLDQGPEICDYDVVHQEFDSLHGGARTVDQAWLERNTRVIAGYARFLRSLGRGRAGHPVPGAAHALLREAVAEMVRHCRRSSAVGQGFDDPPDARVSGLLSDLERLVLKADSAAGEPPPTLLVVDDSATSRLLFRIYLPAELGYTVLEAEDAAGAVSQALASHPRAIFLDYNMPGEDGVAIARRIRAAGVASAFILLTANVQETVLDSARAAGFAGVLEKPVTRDKFINVLHSLK